MAAAALVDTASWPTDGIVLFTNLRSKILGFAADIKSFQSASGKNVVEMHF